MKNLADSLSAPPVSGAAAQTKASTTKPLRLGLLTALVIGSMIGSGVFSLPQNMASGAGAAAVLIGWLITGVGMLMLAFVYQTLTTRKPDLDNGSYAYARASAGEFVGFNSAWRCHVPVDERWSQRGHRQRARASGPALQDETQGGRRSSHWPRRMARRCEDPGRIVVAHMERVAQSTFEYAARGTAADVARRERSCARGRARLLRFSGLGGIHERYPVTQPDVR